MEFSENELKNIVAGTNQKVAEELALKNEELFREKNLEALKQQRQEIINDIQANEPKNEQNDYSK